MPSTNLSISMHTPVEFSCLGWPESNLYDLVEAVRRLAAVSSVRVTAGDQLEVRYDPATTELVELVAAVNKAADTILPGHDFSSR